MEEAISEGHLEVLKAMQDYCGHAIVWDRRFGANTNTEPLELDSEWCHHLHIAANWPRIIQHLIDGHYTDHVNMRNKEGESALHWAVILGSAEAICILLSHSAEVNARTRNGSKTPLHLAVESRARQDIIRALLSGDVDVDAVNADGQTALHTAASNGDDHIVALLLDAGASSALRHDGLTAEHLALIGGHELAQKRLSNQRSNVVRMLTSLMTLHSSLIQAE